jgi:urea carboxylase
MEGPGGYQFVGRTIQMWNRWNQTKDFVDGKPWLLRFFDQIRFYPVEADELLQLREDFLHGKFKLKIEEQTFRLKDYNQFLTNEAETINAFKIKRQNAFDAERERWISTGQANYSNETEATRAVDLLETPTGSRVIASHVAGNLWQIKLKEGDLIQEGDEVAVVESMKMEISVTANVTGKVTKILCSAGMSVYVGQNLIVIAEE